MINTRMSHAQSLWRQPGMESKKKGHSFKSFIIIYNKKLERNSKQHLRSSMIIYPCSKHR